MEYNASVSLGNVPSSHSLQADIVTGWKPKMKIIGPMPLNFDNPHLDKTIRSIMSSDTSIYSVVYLGPRPSNAFQMHEMLAKRYKYKYMHLLSGDFGYLKSFFHKFYGQLVPMFRRPFHGMNPELKKVSVTFDSCFESGNLDCAIRLRQTEYDLILRIDSNTAGHISWYYFKVCNKDTSRRTIKFNIINLRRIKSAYERGMRPFVKRANGQWRQEGNNVSIADEKIRYNKQNLLHAAMGDHYELDVGNLFRRLSFELDFEPEEEIQVAYCVPYLYSQLLADIKHYKRLAAEDAKIYLEIDVSNESLSGLQIPILKISEANEQLVEKKRYCIFCIGRQHPGESNGSYVMKGLIESLLKTDSLTKSLRAHCTFVFIPMLNPDGVVMGNFRASLFGKDLNRLFKTYETALIPEVQLSRALLIETSKTYKSRLLLFLDIHGHSTRRNSFCFGPGILDAQLFNDIRYFPKIIASKTEIFRYPSCSFRISNDKKTTARALFSRFVGLSYTIESSNWSYYSKEAAKVIEFDAYKWSQVGFFLKQSIEEYVSQKVLAKQTKKAKKMKELDQQTNYNQKSKDQKLQKTKKPISYQQQSPSKSASKKNSKRSLQSTKYLRTTQSQIQPQSRVARLETFAQIEEKQQENESDRMSENGMDTDSEGEDLPEEKFKHYINLASQMIIEFEKAYYGESYSKKDRPKQKPLAITISRSQKLLIKERKKMEALACMRKKQIGLQEPLAEKMKLERRPAANQTKDEGKPRQGQEEDSALLLSRVKSKSELKDSRASNEEAIKQLIAAKIGDSKKNLKLSVPISQLLCLQQIDNSEKLCTRQFNVKMQKSKSILRTIQESRGKQKNNHTQERSKDKDFKDILGEDIQSGKPPLLKINKIKMNSTHNQQCKSQHQSPTRQPQQINSPILPKIAKHIHHYFDEEIHNKEKALCFSCKGSNQIDKEGGNNIGSQFVLLNKFSQVEQDSEDKNKLSGIVSSIKIESLSNTKTMKINKVGSQYKISTSIVTNDVNL